MTKPHFKYSNLGNLNFNSEEYIVVEIKEYKNFDNETELKYDLRNRITGEMVYMVYTPPVEGTVL